MTMDVAVDEVDNKRAGCAERGSGNEVGRVVHAEVHA